MKLVTFRSVKDAIQANLIKSAIEQAGFFCTIEDDTSDSPDPFSPLSYGGIQIKVKEEDFDKVHELLASDEEE